MVKHTHKKKLGEKNLVTYKDLQFMAKKIHKKTHIKINMDNAQTNKPILKITKLNTKIKIQKLQCHFKWKVIQFKTISKVT